MGSEYREPPDLAAPAGFLLLPSGRESAVPGGGSLSRRRKRRCVPRAGRSARPPQAEGAGRGIGAGCHLGQRARPFQGHCQRELQTVSAAPSDPVSGSLQDPVPRGKAAWKAS